MVEVVEIVEIVEVVEMGIRNRQALAQPIQLFQPIQPFHFILQPPEGL